jgi:hypothetical protein
MARATNPLDNVVNYVGLITDPERDTRVAPADGSTINGRAAVDDDEAAVIKAAREQERAACAATVAGIGRGR